MKWLAALSLLIVLTVAALRDPYASADHSKTATQRIDAFLAEDSSRGAVLVLGDSNMEWAKLPKKLCGVSVLNAAQSGARAADVLPILDYAKISGLKVRTVVVSVGINDAISPAEMPFAAAYPAILGRAALMADTVYVVNLAPVDPTGADGRKVNLADRAAINASIVGFAKRQSVAVVDVSKIGIGTEPLTKDGIHFTGHGYDKWIGAIVGAVNCKK